MPWTGKRQEVDEALRRSLLAVDIDHGQPLRDRLNRWREQFWTACRGPLLEEMTQQFRKDVAKDDLGEIVDEVTGEIADRMLDTHCRQSAQREGVVPLLEVAIRHRILDRLRSRPAHTWVSLDDDSESGGLTVPAEADGELGLSRSGSSRIAHWLALATRELRLAEGPAKALRWHLAERWSWMDIVDELVVEGTLRSEPDAGWRKRAENRIKMACRRTLIEMRRSLVEKAFPLLANPTRWQLVEEWIRPDWVYEEFARLRGLEWKSAETRAHATSEYQQLVRSGAGVAPVSSRLEEKYQALARELGANPGARKVRNELLSWKVACAWCQHGPHSRRIAEMLRLRKTRDSQDKLDRRLRSVGRRLGRALDQWIAGSTPDDLKRPPPVPGQRPPVELREKRQLDPIPQARTKLDGHRLVELFGVAQSTLREPVAAARMIEQLAQQALALPGHEALACWLMAEAAARYRAVEPSDGDRVAAARADEARCVRVIGEHAIGQDWIGWVERVLREPAAHAIELNRISEAPVFVGLAPLTCAAIDGAANLVTFPRQDYLCVQDLSASNMYVIRQGKVATLDGGDHAWRFVRLRLPGECIGEMALYERRWHRTASCLAVEDVEAWSIPYSALEQLLIAYPDLEERFRGLYFRRRVEQRLGDLVARMRRGGRGSQERSEGQPPGSADRLRSFPELQKLDAARITRLVDMAEPVWTQRPRTEAAGPAGLRARSEPATPQQKRTLVVPGAPRREVFLLLDGVVREEVPRSRDLGKHLVTYRAADNGPRLIGYSELRSGETTWSGSLKPQTNTWVARFPVDALLELLGVPAASALSSITDD